MIWKHIRTGKNRNKLSIDGRLHLHLETAVSQPRRSGWLPSGFTLSWWLVHKSSVQRWRKEKLLMYMFSWTFPQCNFFTALLLLHTSIGERAHNNQPCLEVEYGQQPIRFSIASWIKWWQLTDWTNDLNIKWPSAYSATLCYSITTFTSLWVEL